MVGEDSINVARLHLHAPGVATRLAGLLDESAHATGHRS